MKKEIIISLLIVLLLIPLVNAAAKSEISDIGDYSVATFDVSVKGELSINPSGNVKAELRLFPITDARQGILSLSRWSNPQASIKQQEKSILYTWDAISSAQFGVDSEVQIIVNKLGSSKASFPLENKENLEYTRATENIDINAEITKKANEIVAGKTDALKATAALADFVHNYVTYDESYGNTIKKASFVFQSRRGVCDEYTNLFIAMCRAVGLPGRYVSGVAYSNIKDEFGNHAWAEVYIPGHDWIPFDPTYGQSGWIDVSHIALAKSQDTQSSVLYSYPGGSVINNKEITISTEIKSKMQKFSPKESIEIRLLKNNVKAGSYVPLEVKVKNNQNYYLPVSIYISKSSGLYGENTQNLILAPTQESTLFFIIETPTKDIEEGYKYTSFIEVKSSYNSIATTELTFSKNYEDELTLSEAQNIVNALTKEEREDKYNIDLECNTEREIYYNDEKITLYCNTTNKGNVPLENLNLCVKTDCRTFSLDIGKQKTEPFTLEEGGDYIINVKNSFVSMSTFLDVKVLEKPNLKILNVDKNELNYAKDNISLIIETKSVCKNLVVNVNKFQMKINETDLKKELPLNLAGKDALSGKIKVSVECYDLKDRKYEDSQTFQVTIINAPFYAKILQIFARLFG